MTAGRQSSLALASGHRVAAALVHPLRIVAYVILFFTALQFQMIVVHPTCSTPPARPSGGSWTDLLVFFMRRSCWLTLAALRIERCSAIHSCDTVVRFQSNRPDCGCRPPAG